MGLVEAQEHRHAISGSSTQPSAALRRLEYHSPTSDRENDTETVPPRHTSTTPTPRNLGDNVPVSPSIGHRDNMAGPSQNGKNRRTEPYSDEETGVDGDIHMEGQGSTRQHGEAGVKLFFARDILVNADFPTESVCDRR